MAIIMNSFLAYLRKFILLFAIFYSFFAIRAENDANKISPDYQFNRLNEKADLLIDKDTCEKFALCAVISGKNVAQPCASLLYQFSNSSPTEQKEYLNKCETILKEAELDKNKDN